MLVCNVVSTEKAANPVSPALDKLNSYHSFFLKIWDFKFSRKSKHFENATKLKTFLLDLYFSTDIAISFIHFDFFISTSFSSILPTRVLL